MKRSSCASYWILLAPSFLLLIGDFVYMWLMWALQYQSKFFSTPQTALLVQHEPALQQLGLFQCWGLPGRFEYIVQLWSATHLLFQLAAVGFCQHTSILNYNTLFTNALSSQSSAFQLFQTFSSPFLSVDLPMLFHSSFGYPLRIYKYSSGLPIDCPTLILGIGVTLQMQLRPDPRTVLCSCTDIFGASVYNLPQPVWAPCVLTEHMGIKLEGN